MISDTLKLHLHNTQDIVLIFILLQHLEKRSGFHFSAIKEALDELIENILEHAYKESSNAMVDISVTFTLKRCRLYVEVQEFGVPFDFTPFLSEAIDQSSDHSKGFYRIYDLIDTFYFTNLGKEGKRFTLISQLRNCQLPQNRDQEEKPKPQTSLNEIDIRPFRLDDAQEISRLIYQNYDYTYYKAMFYDPSAIAEHNISQRIHSFVALHQEKIIGHFALAPRSHTNCSEISVAVVDPNYKGMGIMNKMFVSLIDYAKAHRFRSLFGEAIMLHPYSQKANLKKGMKESALVLGLVPEDIEIEHELKLTKRSGVLVGYLIFEKRRPAINLPSVYKEWIEATYKQFDIILDAELPTKELTPIQTHLDTELNLGVIQIDLEVDAATITTTLERLMLEQSDMIYADINLHRISQLDAIVDALNEHGFFYSGVMFDFYHDEDYMRLQKVCTHNIELEHLVTYSEFGKELLAFVREDKKRLFH